MAETLLAALRAALGENAVAVGAEVPERNRNDWSPLPPVTPPAGNLVVGTGPTGLPVDPNAPPVVATATTPAGDEKAANKPKPKPKPKPAGPKKPPPGKPAVVDPF